MPNGSDYSFNSNYNIKVSLQDSESKIKKFQI